MTSSQMTQFLWLCFWAGLPFCLTIGLDWAFIFLSICSLVEKLVYSITVKPL
jgi:hypothetical protein